jgi:phage terminase large subunit-like protein
LYHKFYVPSETINERYKHENINIKEWATNGIVTAIPGNIIDYSYIEKDLIEYSKDYNIIEIAYDRWNSNRLIDNLDTLFPNTLLVQVDQSLKSLANPTKEFERLIYEKRIRCNNPCRTWMMSNATIKTDVNGIYKPLKEGKSSTKRIDGVISSLMAISRCIANEDNTLQNKDFNSILNLF